MKDAGCVHLPQGAALRTLVEKHLTLDNLDPEIKGIIEGRLLGWAREIRG
jgi:hypothetical protein